MLAKPMRLVVSKTGDITWSGGTAEASGETKKGTMTYGVIPKLQVDSGTAKTDLTVNIKNSKGFTLPQTGGAGGFLLTVIGCGVMILRIVLFHKSRDNKKEETA